MSGVNCIHLVGRMGKDAEIRVVESGRKVASFTLATSEVYKDKSGNKKEETQWHNIVFWGPIADAIEKYLKKGSQIYVQGKVRYRSYEDKEGVKKYTTEVIGQSMSMLGGGGKQSEAPEAVNAEVISGESEDYDLPF